MGLALRMCKVPFAASVLALVMAFALSSCGNGSQGTLNSEADELRQELQRLRNRLNRLHQAKMGTTHVHVRFESTPLWFAESRESLFASMVVFPNEAKAESWAEGLYGFSEGQENSSNAVRPDRGFYYHTLKSFLGSLANCGDAEHPVRLQAVGFASTSGLTPENTSQGVEEKLAEERERLRSSTPCACCAFAGESDSDTFNLIVSNLRAKHTAAMVAEFVEQLGVESSIQIEPHQWCRHSEMVVQRQVQDGGPESYDTRRGLLNRRVELRVLDLPGCMNFDPAKRVPLPEGAQSAPAPVT